MGKKTVAEVKSLVEAARRESKANGSKAKRYVSCGSGVEVVILPGTLKADFYGRIRNKRTLLGSYEHMNLATAWKKVELAKKKLKGERANDQSPLLKDYFPKWVEEDSLRRKPGSTRSKNILTLFNTTLVPLHNYHLSELTVRLVYDKIKSYNQTPGNKHDAVSYLIMCLDNAVLKGLVENNPLARMLRGPQSAFPPPARMHHPYVKAEEFKEKILLPLRDLPLLPLGYYLLLFLTAFRPGENRLLKWSYCDFEENVIKIPPEAEHSNKTQTETVKPMTRQIRSFLLFWREKFKLYEDMDQVFVLPDARRPRVPGYNMLNDPFKFKVGGVADAYGIRATVRTWLSEELKANEVAAERVLCHEVSSTLERTYNRYGYIEETRDLLQKWDDYLESILPEEFLRLL